MLKKIQVMPQVWRNSCCVVENATVVARGYLIENNGY